MLCKCSLCLLQKDSPFYLLMHLHTPLIRKIKFDLKWHFKVMALLLPVAGESLLYQLLLKRLFVRHQQTERQRGDCLLCSAMRRAMEMGFLSALQNQPPPGTREDRDRVCCKDSWLRFHFPLPQSPSFPSDLFLTHSADSRVSLSLLNHFPLWSLANNLGEIFCLEPLDGRKFLGQSLTPVWGGHLRLRG